MKLPLQITFRNMEPSEALEANIQKKANKLDQVCNQIMRCRVVIDEHHQHHHQGNLFHVSIDLTVPDKEIVVNRDPAQHHAHEDAYVAVRDAFNAAHRQLEKYNQQHQQHVKRHETPAHGRILELLPKEDYGRIETPDGREIYFHRHSLLSDDFDHLEVGDEMRFVEEQGESGPQASTVVLIGKHHLDG